MIVKYNIQIALPLLFFLLFGVIISNIVIANTDLSPYLDLTINEEKFLPGQTLIVKAYLYNSPMQGDIEVMIIDTNANLFLKKFVIPENSIEYTFESNASAGDWKIIASYDNLSAKRIISIGEKEAIYSRMADDKLIIKNIGNIPYTKPIKITFINDKGEEEIIARHLTLKLDEENEFQLHAKDGIYDIIIEKDRFNNIPLIGRVTSAIQLKKKPGFLLQYPITAFFIFLVLIIFIILLTSHLKEKPFKLYGRKEKYVEIERKPEKIPVREPIDLSQARIELKRTELKSMPYGEEAGLSVYPPRKAEHKLVLNGKKQGTTVLVVNAKNLSELKNKLETGTFDALKDFLEKQVSMEIEENRGVLQRISDYSLMGIFSVATKQFRHEIAAIKAALKIRDALESYNRKLKDKLEYGIGVNTGELVVSIDKAIQYTSIGNTLALAKKIAEMSKKDVYVARDTYLRASSEIQCNRIGSINTSKGTIDIYSVKSIGGRELYKSYLTDILNRMKKE